MTVTVNLHSVEEEKALIEFLDKMNYEYLSDNGDFTLTDSQKQEVIRRDNDFINGKTTARDWNDIKRDFSPLLVLSPTTEDAQG
ncbi:addiction module protein [Mucilaginibacter sp. BJC16-A38]|uniref:addiction module protein n=1 Tax=Mucilaginibacter phenanthrenivorans TaxID=1234842 RepID=UPI002157B0DE|nr:addiction module protein [Mucilaginibacter phenanthrenivorans]MCR8561452.1 addiction module protein [Mucilaginibacter phenanthrenivorans]